MKICWLSTEGQAVRRRDGYGKRIHLRLYIMVRRSRTYILCKIHAPRVCRVQTDTRNLHPYLRRLIGMTRLKEYAQQTDSF